jgi:biopolymer transport protein ExbD
MRIFETAKLRRMPAIRMINLVDILLNLLIFFIATTTFRIASPAAVKLELPAAKTAEELGRQKLNQIVISVSADQQIYLDSTPISLPALETALREAKEKNPDVVVQLSADKSVSYGTVVGIVDAARAAGVRNITAFTKKSVR